MEVNTAAKRRERERERGIEKKESERGTPRQERRREKKERGEGCCLPPKADFPKPDQKQDLSPIEFTRQNSTGPLGKRNFVLPLDFLCTCWATRRAVAAVPSGPLPCPPLPFLVLPSLLDPPQTLSIGSALLGKAAR